MHLIPPSQTQDQEKEALLATSEDEGIVLSIIRELFFLVAPPGLDTCPPTKYLIAKSQRLN
jgi:hypothetical protein